MTNFYIVVETTDNSGAKRIFNYPTKTPVPRVGEYITRVFNDRKEIFLVRNIAYDLRVQGKTRIEINCAEL